MEVEIALVHCYAASLNNTISIFANLVLSMLYTVSLAIPNNTHYNYPVFLKNKIIYKPCSMALSLQIILHRPSIYHILFVLRTIIK